MGKRYLLLLTMIMLFITGCGGQETISDDYKRVEDASKTVYTLNSKKYFLQGEQLYCLNQSDISQSISITDIKQNSPKRTVAITLQEQESVDSFFVLKNNSLYIVVHQKSIENDVEQYTLALRKYNDNYELEWETTIEENIPFVVDMVVDGEGNIFLAHSYTLLKYSPNGELLQKKEGIEGRIQNLLLSKGDTVYSYYEGKNEFELAPLDKNSLMIGDKISYSSDFTIQKANQGFYATGNGNLYEWVEDKKGFQPLFSLEDAYIEGSGIRGISQNENGSYLLCYSIEEGYSYEADSLEVDLFAVQGMEPTKQNQSIDEQNIAHLSFATLNPNNYINIVDNFNRKHEEYHIKILKYSDDVFASLAQIDASMLSKEPPDIINSNVSDTLKRYKSYVKMNYILDLKPYFENSKLISLEDFLPRVVEDFTIDGKIYGLPKYATISSLAFPTKILGGKTSWTIEEFLDVLEEYPNAYSFQDATVTNIKTEILYSCMNYGINGFIDWETKTAYFNEKRFQDILRRIQNLDIQLTSKSNEERRLDGETLIFPLRIYKPRDLQQTEWLNHQGEEMTLMGYPTGIEGDISRGRISYTDLFTINRNTAYFDAAWSFVESFLSGIKKYTPGFQGFSLGKESFEGWLQEETKVEYRTDENGDFILDENGEKIEEFYTYDGVPYPAITQTQVDKVRKAVEEAFVNYDIEADLVAIIRSESPYYFDNKKSLEEVTDIIQNRIQIYLSEN